MSPKSLLRHPEVVSDLSEFETKNNFKEIIDDPKFGPRSGKKVKKLLMCTGKVYFDLLAKQKADNREDVAIVRMEQLYPIVDSQIEAIFKKYADAETIWVQEEPENMGAWQHVFMSLYQHRPLKVVARKASASPATGFKKVHDQQQMDIVERAFK